jgi:hypothetical protein
MNTQSQPSDCQGRGLVLTRFAAKFSFIAPFAAYVIYILIQQSRTLTEAQSGFFRVVGLALAISILLLPVLGFVSGIASLVATKRYGRKGIFGWALAGVLICGLFLSLVVLVVIAVQHHYARHAA